MAIDPLAFQSEETIVIDALLEEQEREKQRHLKRAPLDISFLFDTAMGCPDDVVVHCMQYLDPREHSKLLALDRETRKCLIERADVWRHLCSCKPHWKLPRRPRKPWHVLYLTHLQAEYEDTRKACDELLNRAVNILLKGDLLQKFKRSVLQAERDQEAFNINYTSGVSCERNSLLNLAVIHQRVKIIKVGFLYSRRRSQE